MNEFHWSFQRVNSWFYFLYGLPVLNFTNLWTKSFFLLTLDIICSSWPSFLKVKLRLLVFSSFLFCNIYSQFYEFPSKHCLTQILMSYVFIFLSSFTQLCSLFATPWTAACQASLSITNSGVYPNSCPLSRWCHPTMSSSVVPFFSCLQSLPASGSFQMSQFFTSGGQSIGVSASTSVLPMNTQDWSPLGWTGWISLQSRGLSKVSNKFKSISHLALSFLYSPTFTSIHDYWKNHSLDWPDFCWQSNVSALCCLGQIFTLLLFCDPRVTWNCVG